MYSTKPKPLTDEEKAYQNQLKLEKELVSLKKEYSTFLHKSSNSSYEKKQLEKQSHVITLFLKEHEEVLTDLAVATSKEKQEHSIVYRELDHLLNEYNDVNGDVDKYQTYMKEIQDQIRKAKKNVVDLRKQQITDRQYEDRVWAAIKTVEALENKLEVQMKKFGCICGKNRQLREEIEHLLWDRRNFLSTWNKLIRKLSEGKQIMLDLIEQATIAHNQRKDWYIKLRVLRQKAFLEFTENQIAMRENKMKLDNSIKLEEFMMIKGQKRVMRDLEKMEKEKRRKRIEELVSKLQYDLKLYTEIKEFVKETNVKVIVEKYLRQDELNFSNFRYIVETLGEMEKMGDDLDLLYLDIDDSYKLHRERTEKQTEKINNLEGQLAEIENKIEEFNSVIKIEDSTYNNLLQGIGSLFKLMKCDVDPLVQLLGDNTTVQFYNVDLYLKILENKILEDMVKVNYKQMKVPNEKKVIDVDTMHPVIYPIDKIVLKTPCSLCVEHEMVADFCDSVQRVLKRKDAEHKLAVRLASPNPPPELHTLSHCQLPKARHLMQKMYE